MTEAQRTPPSPKSIEGHTVPPERMAMIEPHMAILAAAALEVSDMLPLQADAADFVAVLEAEAD